MSKKKYEQVDKIYYKMARMNGLQVTDEAINMFREQNVAETVRFIYLFLFFRKHISVYNYIKMPYLQIYLLSKIQL